MENIIMAIATVLMAVATIINMVLAQQLGRLSITYNKNALKPIGVISVEDYDNKISVSILNAGNGPMTIKSFSCTNGTQSSLDLISLMPDLGQKWTTFYKRIIGDTIMAGGEATLIELNPQNEKEVIRRRVRETLKDITVYMEYTDVHDTVFTTTKTLDFFGRPMMPGK